MGADYTKRDALFSIFGLQYGIPQLTGLSISLGVMINGYGVLAGISEELVMDKLSTATIYRLFGHFVL